MGARMLRVLTVVMLLSVFVGTAVGRPARSPAPGQTLGRSGNPVRTQRGFKNASLSVARGFGKRNYDPDMEAAIASAAERIDSFPVSWLLEEMQNNPELVRLVVEKFVDENGDGELTAEEILSRFY